MLGGKDQIVLSAAPRHDDHTLGAGSIQHRECVAHRCPPVVGTYVEGAVRTPVAAPVECHHPAMAGEVGNLELPRPGVDDFPGWHEQDGGLALAVGLVVDPDPITLNIARLVRVTRPRLLAGRRGHLSIHRSIHSRSPRCLVSMPPKRSNNDAKIERHHVNQLQYSSRVRLAKPCPVRARSSGQTRALMVSHETNLIAIACMSAG